MPFTKWSLALIVVAGCVGDSSTVDGGTDATADQAIEAGPSCDPTKPFGAPVALSELASVVFDRGAAYLSSDELSLYFAASVGDAGNSSLMFSQRPSKADPFGPPALLTLTGNDSAHINTHPTVTPDQLTLLFQSNIDEPQFDIFAATRASVTTPFASPQIVTSLSLAANYDTHPYFTSDGSELWFASNRSSTSFDLWHASYTNGTFGTPAAETELDTPLGDEEHPVLSADKLTIYFGVDAAGDGGTKDWDIVAAKRTSAAVAFGAPLPVAELNSAQSDYPAWISPDSCRFYLTRNGALLRATRPQ